MFLLALVGNLGDTEGEERAREEGEGLCGGEGVADFGEEGVLVTGGLVGGGLQGAEGALDCIIPSAIFLQRAGEKNWCGLTLEELFTLAVENAGAGFEGLGLEEIGDRDGLWGGFGLSGLLLGHFGSECRFDWESWGALMGIEMCAEVEMPG